METTNNFAKFKEGERYHMTFIGDRDLRPVFLCLKRTAKMVTLKSEATGEVLKKRIKKYSDNNSEYILEGNYSMAPRISAQRIVKK